MAEEPKEYSVQVVWDHEKGGEVRAESKQSIKIVRPKGDEGTPDLYTPEHLFVASATACFMNSFIYFTRRMHIEFRSFECEGTGILEQVGKSFEVTKIEIKSRVSIESEDLRSKIERAIYLGHKYCFIGNSMKASIAYEDEIVVG
ncbi:MAG: OsmC family protein [Candidatus Thorarchaeota archaeon]|jgi:organic hydroperoxide reductase OsmC/OhrA